MAAGISPSCGKLGDRGSLSIEDLGKFDCEIAFEFKRNQVQLLLDSSLTLDDLQIVLKTFQELIGLRRMVHEPGEALGMDTDLNKLRQEISHFRLKLSLTE